MSLSAYRPLRNLLIHVSLPWKHEIMSSTQKLLVVFGATGHQGGSVIRTVLQDADLKKQYVLRGTTRDPDSPGAQALADQGVEVVKADVEDPASLRKAFEGAHTVFANTITVYDGHAYEHEVAHGKALAGAAMAAGVPYYIYSTLPHAGQISGLKHMGHFDGKAEAEAYIRTLPMKSAFIAPGSFMENFHASLTPRPMGDVYGIANFVAPETQLPLIAAANDTGKWVAAILADFERYNGQVLCCATRLYSMQETVEIMSKASGKTVVYKQLPREVWSGFLPEMMRDHIGDMFEHFQRSGYYGPETEERVVWSAKQARGTLTSLEEYLQAHPLQLG